MKQKGNILVLFLSGVALIAIFLAGYFYLQLPKTSLIQTPGSKVSITDSKPVNETANWKTYTNTLYGYQIKYPQNIFVTEVDGPAWAKGQMLQVTNEKGNYFNDLSVETGLQLIVSVSKENSDNQSELQRIRKLSAMPVNSGDTHTLKIADVSIGNYKSSLFLDDKDTNEGIQKYRLHSYLEANNNYYYFVIEAKNKEILIKSKDMFTQILSTFKFVDKVEVQTPSAQLTKLNYALPTGWQTVQDTTGTLQMGYDPKLNQLAEPKDLAIGLTGKWEMDPARKIGSNMTFFVKPYDGGSRHTFILRSRTDWEKMPTYYEKEYVYNGWNCLVLYGIYISQSDTVWGMCATSPKQAVGFSIGGGTNAEVEKIISTIRLLK